MNEKIDLAIWGIRIIVFLWTAFLIYSFANSWRIIPINKYRGRLAGQICLIITHTILLTIIWLQAFDYHLSGGIWALFFMFAVIFFMLWLMFNQIERKDLLERISKSRKKFRKSEMERMRAEWKQNNTTAQ